MIPRFSLSYIFAILIIFSILKYENGFAYSHVKFIPWFLRTFVWTKDIISASMKLMKT